MKEMNFEQEMEEIKRQISELPEKFGLRAFSGVFAINKNSCFFDGETIQLVIYNTDTGNDLTRGTLKEIKRELVVI